MVSEYFGRGLFNKLTVVTEAPEPVPFNVPSTVPYVPSVVTVPSAPVPTYGPGAEAKLRLQEGQSKQGSNKNMFKNFFCLHFVEII